MGNTPARKHQVEDELILEFLQAVFGKGLHPEDACVEVGLPYPTMYALRATHPVVDAAWFLAEEKAKGKIKTPKTPLEIKHRFIPKLWRILEPKILAMIDRIPDTRLGDQQVMDLLKNRIISETLPKETASSVQTQHIPNDPLDKLSEEQLWELAEKKLGVLADLKGQAMRAHNLRMELEGKDIIDAEYTVGDTSAPEGDGGADTPPGGQPARTLHVECEAVAGDYDEEADADGGGGESVLREDDS